MPAGTDACGRTEVGFDSCLTRCRGDRQSNKLRRDLDRLIGLGNRELKRRDSHGRHGKIGRATVRRCCDRGGQFERHFVLARLAKQQCVLAVAGASQQNLAVFICRQFADGRAAECDRHFDPRLAEDPDGQFRFNSQQRLVDRRRVVSFRDDALDVFPAGSLRLLPQLQVLRIRHEHGRAVLCEDVFEVSVWEVNQPLERAGLTGFGLSRAVSRGWLVLGQAAARAQK